MSSRHVRRARLHTALTAATLRRFVVVAALAGSGKTELVRAWSAEQPPTVFCDLADGRPRRLCIEGAAAAAAGSTLLALDNVHRASQPHLDEVIQVVADPAGPRLVLLGRWLPPRLRAAFPAADTAQLDGSALALTVEETGQLCARYGDLPPELSEEVFAATVGCAVGAVIAANRSSLEPVCARQHLQQLFAGGADLHDYVVHDILGHLRPDDLRAVCATAVVEAVCPELFTALTGRTDALRLLQDLARDDMFAQRVGDRGWYQYRRVWRAALYHHTEPARLRGLHRTASDWYAAHCRYREALHHAAAAQDRGRAADLGRDHHLDISVGGAQATATPPTPWTPWTWTDLSPTRATAPACPPRGSDRASSAHPPRHLAMAAEPPMTPTRTPAADAAQRAGQQRRPRGDVDLWHADPALTAAEHLHHAMIAQQRGDLAAALHITHRLVHDDAPTSDLHYLHVQLLLAAGYRTDAERHATTSAAACTEPVRRLITATLLLDQGHPRHATAGLQPFLQQLDAPTLYRIDALLLVAAAAAHLGDSERAAELRHQAHRLAVPAGIRRPFLIEQLNTRHPIRSASPRGGSASPNLVADSRAAASAVNLTDAELAVLELLDTLLTNTEIAERLHLSINTVKTHLSSVYRKLGVHRRRDAINRAHELRLPQSGTT